MRIIAASLILFFIAGCAHTASCSQICFQKKCVSVTIVRSPEAMSRGLSGHPPLAMDEGMLFVFDRDGQYSFWMNAMDFDIDILWINRENKVVHIEQNLTPCTAQACPKYSSDEPAAYVLEVSAGYVTKNNITLGDSVILSE